MLARSSGDHALAQQKWEKDGELVHCHRHDRAKDWARARLLIGLLAVGLCTACAAVDVRDETAGFLAGPSPERLVIDQSRATATTPRWSSEIVDCSNQEQHCILIPGRMVLAFPKSCSDAGAGRRPDTGYGELREVAPTPHLAPPSGSYVVGAFPNVLLFYDVSHGFNEVRIVRRSPYDREFDPNDYSERYDLITPKGVGLFICSE